MRIKENRGGGFKDEKGRKHTSENLSRSEKLAAVGASLTLVSVETPVGF